MKRTRPSPGKLVARPPARQLKLTLDNMLGYQLRRAQEASFDAFARSVGDTHIWPGWFALLSIIHDNPHINQATLSRASGRDKSTLSASLRELQKLGLIVRERDPADGRSFALALTDLGRSHLRMLEKHAKAHDKRLDAIVGPENKLILIEILKSIATEFGNG